MDKMLASLGLDQFYRWSEYDQIEPFGEGRADLRMGTMCAVIENSIIAAITGKPGTATAKDFIPDFTTLDASASTDPTKLKRQFKSIYGKQNG